MVLDQNTPYYERMASSIGDKARLLPFVKGELVLEVGFGGGELLDILDAQGFDVYGLDASPISEAKVLQKAYGIHTIEAYADEIGRLTDGLTKNFDDIIFSSVMHEVYAYGNREGKGKHDYFGSVSPTLQVIHDSLEKGGRFILRDGVMDANWDQQVVLTMLNGDVQGVEDYLNRQPYKDRIKLTYMGNNKFTGNLQSVQEFAYTYTWGKNALPRESQELFGLFTLEEYANFIEMHGFTIVHKEEYVQQGYVDALSPKLAIHDTEGNPVDFPPTNAIWVAEKL